MNSNTTIITIDGPASSGKGTIAKLLASHLEAFHLDSGLLYRAIAYYVSELNIADRAFDSCETWLGFKKSFHVEYEFSTQKSRILQDTADITELLRQQTIGKKASHIAQFLTVRQIVTEKIGQMVDRYKTIVADGRDMGTVVFPNASFHFYLNASLDIRAQRRYQELIEKGVHITFDSVKQDLEQRDFQDSHRIIAPLAQSKRAVEIHTDFLTPAEILQSMLSLIKKR